MDVVIGEEPLAAIEEHARIPIAFRVERVLVVGPESAGLAPSERPLARPWTRDYDAIPGNHPRDWLRRFDTTHWARLVARRRGEAVGGAVLARRTPELELLEGRDDLALLWDLRVVPAFRRRGVGASLFAAAERWARAHGCTGLRVETQDINVPACRFYARCGCTLESVDPGAYPRFPGETRLTWRRDLGGPPEGRHGSGAR